MMTSDSSRKRRPVRPLSPAPRPAMLHKNCASVTDFLRSAAVPVGCQPESVDTAFKAHTSLMRKSTLDSFDLNRYLFAYKPLARANAVLASALLSIVEIDQKHFPLSPALRSAVMYVAGNAHHSVFVMTYAAQLKSIMRSRPPTEGILPAIVLEGRHLTDKEIAALDFAQELSGANAVVSESTRRRVINGDAESDGRLERLVSSASSYAAFLACLTSTVDMALPHGSITYATKNLDCLPWKSSGAPVNVGFLDDEMGDFGLSTAPSGFSSKYRPKRERLSLNRHYDRHHRDRSRSRHRGIRRVSQFFAASIMGPKTVTDVNRITESWMKTAGVPPSGRLFDINDEICSLFGFHPFYFSTAAMERESVRRAFLFGAKELLFSEKEVPRRLKFLLCYVLSSGKERQRIVDSEHSKSFQKQGVHNGHSITSVYSQRQYDSLSIMSAHAAFLACKYGASPAELVAASDASRVRSAMERYDLDPAKNWSSRTIGFPLVRRDCAAILIVHSLMQATPVISERDLRSFESAFAGQTKDPEYSSRPSRRALMEVLGTASMWSAFERYATGTLAFDIDCTSNMVFGNGRAEPTISEFCRGNEGRKIGLSLATSECRDVMRVRSESKASRQSSLRPTTKSARNLYRKRTSSALSSTSRMGRIFSSSTSESQHHNKHSIAVR
ncbi:unnamed protein product [Chondrus crispus]|uniref:Uncharacterized protein n=1 Tax=Chondrus crispus TaxID=2769 RepID=R7QVB8_CHOCR|nr:unnamed protein product [Chondrus crispus]CDF41406.1 unnamed protein product [Chondrus crispus]|eukprot:XP_005711700.1 unnamed protein product [Chondrus crispus]